MGFLFVSFLCFPTLLFVCKLSLYQLALPLAISRRLLCLCDDGLVLFFSLWFFLCLSSVMIVFRVDQFCRDILAPGHSVRVCVARFRCWVLTQLKHVRWC